MFGVLLVFALVHQVRALVLEHLLAVLTEKRYVLCVSPTMRGQRRAVGEALPTLTGERARPRVLPQVNLQIVGQREGGATLWTGVGLLLLMDAPDVACEM